MLNASVYSAFSKANTFENYHLEIINRIVKIELTSVSIPNELEDAGKRQFTLFAK